MFAEDKKDRPKVLQVGVLARPAPPGYKRLDWMKMELCNLCLSKRGR